MEQTIAVAVDGMEPSLIREWCAEGELPTIRRFRNKGPHGTARCSSLSSAKQWTTHFTGVDADRHGVHGFTKSGGSRRAGDDAPDTRELVNCSDITVKTYPELLGEAGRAVGLLNPLPLWPPLEFEKGFCISGMLTPPASDRWVSPESLAAELEDLDYRIDIRYGDRPYGFIDDSLFREVDIDTIYEDVFAVLDARIAATKHLVETRRTDFLYVLLKSIDVIQHCFWAHMDANDPTYGEAILESYRRVDDLLAWLRDETDGNLLVFSDHGFKARKTRAPGPVDRLARTVDDHATVPSVVQSAYDRLFKSEVDASLENPGRTTGVHADPGVWLASGPNVRRADGLAVRFEDLTATVLALCDQPVPEAYLGEPVDALAVETRTEDVDLSVSRRLSIDKQEVVSERLHNLGYADMVDDQP